MSRPTFIVAEPEPEQALSSRKLLLETFKFNVITAHTSAELFEMLEQFPNVNAVVLHDDTPGGSDRDLIAEIKKRQPKLPVIVLSPNRANGLGPPDRVVNSHKPEELLQTLQQLFGDARKLNSPSERQGAE